MAFIQSSGNRKQINIDLTPMVDLGFLLISFFMLTTSMTKPKAMGLQMPYKPSNDPTDFYSSSAITLMPSKGHQVYYYEGVFEEGRLFRITSFARDGLRKILSDKQRTIRSRKNIRERSLQVIIKPGGRATFDDLVQVLDEMKILNINSYAITDISEAEELLLKAPKQE